MNVAYTRNSLRLILNDIKLLRQTVLGRGHHLYIEMTQSTLSLTHSYPSKHFSLVRLRQATLNTADVRTNLLKNSLDEKKASNLYYLPFFFSSINAVLVDPCVTRMRNAWGLTVEFHLFFFNAFCGSGEPDPFWWCLNLHVEKQCLIKSNYRGKEWQMDN